MEALQQLCQVLDTMQAANAALGDRFTLVDTPERVQGSQGVVQFATLPRTVVCAYVARLHHCFAKRKYHSS